MSNQEIRNEEEYLLCVIRWAIVTVWRWTGKVRYRRSLDNKEVIFLVVMSVLWGAYTPNQIVEQLGIDKKAFYEAIKGHVASFWKSLLNGVGYEIAEEELKGVLEQSASSISRANITVVLDDSLFRRLAKTMALCYKWWGGAMKKVAKGHDAVLLILVVKGDVIPVELELASKQGREVTDRIQKACAMLERLANRLLAMGLDLSTIEVVADSFYTNEDIAEETTSLGFTFIGEGKKNWIFTLGKTTYKLGELKEKELTQSYNNEYFLRLKASHESFSKIILLIWNDGNRPKGLIVKGRSLRGMEIIRAAKNRNAIEQFFRFLKTTLKTSQIKLRSKSGVWATLTLRITSYNTLFCLKKRMKSCKLFRNLTKGQILDIFQRSHIVIHAIQKHFQNVKEPKLKFLNNL